MSIPEDNDLFEQYMREFRPLAPAPLSRRQQVNRTLALAACIVVISGIALLAFRMRLDRKQSSALRESFSANSTQLREPEPLTIRRAHALLIHASSFKAAIDEQSFQPEPQNHQNEDSAFAVLSKEPSL